MDGSMTVKELINELLVCNMDAEVKLFLNEPHTIDTMQDSDGYLFSIDTIKRYEYDVELEFKDWRKGKDG